MGYMGFGMQKWVYTMKPRRPFTKDRKGSFTAIPKYKATFKENPSSSKGSYKFRILLFAIFAVMLIVAIPNFKSYEKKHYQIIENYRTEANNIAFNFLMDSGKYRLKNGNTFGAYSEFKLAKAIYPNDEAVNTLLLETLTLLCIDKGKHCEDLDNLELHVITP